jgi:hypothetical protein
VPLRVRSTEKDNDRTSALKSPDPPPEALVVDLGGPDSNVIKLHITWWTGSSRQHQMMASHDRVLTAISKALKRLAVDDSHGKRPRAA